MISKFILHNQFRHFESPLEINFSKNLNIFVGKNTTGKSTMLALLAHPAALDTYKTLFNRPFLVARISDIIKLDKEKDSVEGNFYSIFYEKNEYITKLTWEENLKMSKYNPRIRVYHGKIDGSNERKNVYPIAYLGLSRLNPISEAIVSENNNDQVTLSKEEKKYTEKNHNNILDLGDSHKNYIVVGLSTGNKKSMCIATDRYHHLSNSAGQDNISQILCTILSFKRLKDKWPDYKGGTIFIDEFEAGLHPSAQKRLINLLLKESKELDLQFFITTHNTSLINMSYSKEDVSSFLFRKNGENISIIDNPPYEAIWNDLTNKPIHRPFLFSEDDEARKFLKIITKDELFNKLTIIEMKMSGDTLKAFFVDNKDELKNSDNRSKNELKNSDILYLLDGDKNGNINFPGLVLPGDDSPEKIILHYLNELKSNNELFKGTYSYDDYYNYGDETNRCKIQKDEKDREILKKWWKYQWNQNTMYKLIEAWKKDNPTLITTFNNTLESHINICLRNRLNRF